jgi:hypothetical protein
MDRTEQQMAALFLEINDNQRRVPSSLRWDLVRLVRSDDQATAMTADVVYELAQRKESPFYDVGIDLTGEKKELTIKQGSLAPEKIGALLDLSWVYAELAPYYSETGRPSIDPVLVIRMLIIGYVFAIRSERQICREVQVNLAYRWFCDLGLEDAIPDHSAFSRARNERFRESDIFRRVRARRGLMHRGWPGRRGGLCGRCEPDRSRANRQR